MKHNLHIKKYPQEGDFMHSYSAFRNILDEDNSIVDFNTDEISLDLKHPLNIECQPSYDGTVNLIINDDVNPPRIINSRFTKIEDNRFRVINRNQKEQTNLYKKGKVDLQTRLFRNLTKIPKLSFVELYQFGQLKGGNYTFYIKFADSDYNKTDIVCESGQVSVFKGNLSDITSISGTLQDEYTDKSVKFILKNIDRSFSKFYVYYSREYSDTNGFRMTETASIIKPYEITSDNQEFIINGFEEIQLESPESLNIQYNYASTVKTQAQVQNMLFFGNITNENVDVKNLQNISYFFDVTLMQKTKSIGWIDPGSYTPSNNDVASLEYYDPKNIYYYLGYWPDEIYRLGVVYIMNDDSLSPVFNLRGCEFTELKKKNTDGSTIQYKTFDSKTKKWIINYIERDEFLSRESTPLANTFGVFKNPEQSNDNSIISNKLVKPWYYQIDIPTELECSSGSETITCNLLDELKNLGVKGFFFVRQKRIPTILCQGLSLKIDKESSIPVLYDGKYFTEGFLNTGRSLGTNGTSIDDTRIETSEVKGSALLSVEANTNPLLQSMLNGNTFLLQRVSEGELLGQNRNYYIQFKDENVTTNRSVKCIYVNSDNPYKVVDRYAFSTRAGCAESVKEFAFFGNSSKKYAEDNRNLVRGIYAPFIGVCGDLSNNSLYNIKIANYTTRHLKDYFTVRRDDNSPFYAISDRFELGECNSVDVYRGDCFTNTTTIRLNRNFVDPDYPINNTIVDKDTWKSHYNGYFNITTDDKEEGPDGNWAKINRGDVNAVPMGLWITFKCLGNRNLGLRAEDHSYPDEEALMGNPRSFYPLQDISTKASNKVAESWLLNDGYSATVGLKTNISAPNVPYIKDQFDNRIMFSNVQVDGDFRNSYRVFQGLSYEDIDRQYGAIVKLIPWSSGSEANLLCVFEHGLGIIPINQQALMTTTTGQSIHLYGAGVLQSRVSVINPDFGSIWPESIVRTPIGVYGVDTYAKKIWRYSDRNGFETISDMKIQRFLNDNISLNEADKYPIIGIKNVKTHYNNYKGDIMFTFYNFVEGKEWNMCFNERLNKWITKYSWIPLYSENINNIFYSLDKKRAEILSYIYDNINSTYGINTSKNQWDLNSDKTDLSETFSTKVSLTGIMLASGFTMTLDSLQTSYIDSNGVEVDIIKDSNWLKENVNITETDKLIKEISWTRETMESLLSEQNLSYKAPLYYKLNVTVKPEIADLNSYSLIKKTIGIVVDYKYSEEYDNLLGNGFYVHGRAGIFDEMNYEDENPDNQIKPTYWYNKQEPFEFEFVVNEPVGLHKIFDNLVIISNKAKPNSIEIEVIGDVYDFKKSGLITEFKNTTIKYDPILNQKTLVTEQECKDMEKVGRRMGNIHYKEDSWYLTVEPIKFKNDKNPEWSSARIRDKFAKIRIKYSGEDPVLITAIKTLINITSS